LIQGLTTRWLASLPGRASHPLKYATLPGRTSKNLTAIIAHPTKKEIENKTRHRKYPYQLNSTQALSIMKDTIVLLFIKPAEMIEKSISHIHDIFIETIEPIRHGRAFPRKHKIGRRRFYQYYKPIC